MTPDVVAPALPSPPDWFARLGEAVADRVNPIVVKEVRQGLRTRTFWVFFTLMLVACLGISLVAFASSDGFGGRTGQVTFLFYFGALACVQFFVIPYSAFRSMAREREEETWVLLTLTGLGPRRILAGKLSSSVLQGLLYASAAAPFLVFSYYLNGISLPTIVVSMAVAGAFQIFLTAVAVSMATLAESRLVRGLLHFILLGWLVLALGLGIGGAVGLAEAARSGDDVFWLVSAAVLFGMLTTGLLFFESAAARLALSTEAYARGPRIALLLQALGGALFFIGAWQVAEETLLAIGAVVVSFYLLTVGTFVASDRDGAAPNHRLGMRWYSLLRPGALRGYVFIVLLLLTLTTGLTLVATFTTMAPEPFAVMLGAPAFALVYLSAPQIIARWVPHPPYQTPAMVRLVFLGLVVVGSGLPALLAEVIQGDAEDYAFNVLNPVVGLMNIARSGADSRPLLMVVWAVAIGLVAWALAVLRRREAESARPPVREPAASSTGKQEAPR